MTQALRIEGLCKQYPTFALRDVSFTMQAGTIMGLIGRNGAGKTTTLKSMLHLVRPDAGRVEILGMDMDTQEQEIRCKLGFVSGGLSYYPRKRLSQITAATRRFYPDWDEARYQSLLSRFALWEEKRTSELSEGMKVKYQLALAMSHGAQLLILDEPTSGLDPVSRDVLLELLLSLCEEEGVSILFSTHIISDLEACADAITYIQNGRVFSSTTKEELLRRYVLVEGAQERLTPQLDAALLGKKQHHGTFSGLLCADSTALAAGCAVSAAGLEQIMVYLEREAEK